MNFLTDSFVSAVQLVLALDQELLSIVSVSLKVSCLSTLIAAVIGVPCGFLIAFSRVPGRQMIITLLNTLLALPTVVIGLLVYGVISRRGVLGSFELLYTPKAIIIGQVILITPLVAALTIAAISKIDDRYRKTAMTLGANRMQTALVILGEARFGISAAVVAAFGRVISEIGISMMLGGNISGFTRTMTTAMALEYDKGAFTLAVALGLVLMGLSFTMNLLFHFFQGRYRS